MRQAEEEDELQTKSELTVGAPGDRYEREADAVADRIMTMPDPALQRQELEDEEAPEVQAQVEGVPIVTPQMKSELDSSRGGGEPLSGDVRSFMEPRFGRDFSSVRVHTGSGAVSMARGLRAEAFTRGSDVYFGSGKYTPNTTSGKKLLAHELAHTVQQRINNSNLQQTPGRYGKIAEVADNSRLAPKIQRKWWEKQPRKSDSSIVYARPITAFYNLKHELRKVDVHAEETTRTAKKTPPGEKNWYYFLKGKVSITQWTPNLIKTEILKIFPSGKEKYVWKYRTRILNEVKKVVSKFRTTHPNSFSRIQGREMALTSQADCIASMNKAVENLYGSLEIMQKNLGSTAFDSIKKLGKKGKILKKNTFVAKYSGSKTRFQISDYKRHVDIPKSAGTWIKKTIRGSKVDGIFPVVISLCNGFHSAMVIAIKNGNSVTLAWKDQYGTNVISTSGIDDKIKHMSKIRFRFRIRDIFNQKYKTSHGSYDDIVNDPRTLKIEKQEKKTILNDMKHSIFAIIKP